MNCHHIKQVCLLLLASLVLSIAEQSQQLNTNVNEIDDKLPEKPEPRQIGVMPYGWLQPAQAVAAAPPVSSSWGSSSPSWLSSSGQSLLSLLRPNVVGGRRSSLTSRLRNLMNALFYRRETTSPYLTSGSSLNYAFRPPPFGFSSGFPTTGLTSALGNQNLYGSASSYRPVVLPNFGSAPADWSNYKQYGSNGQTSYSGSASLPANWNSGSSGTGTQAGAIWNSGSQAGSGSQYSGLSSSSYPSYPSGSSGSSNGAYQASASNVYPNTSYQRSSVNTYSKPQTSANTSVSSSVSSSSSSSSSSSLPNTKSSGYQSK